MITPTWASYQGIALAMPQVVRSQSPPFRGWASEPYFFWCVHPHRSVSLTANNYWSYSSNRRGAG
jgi:hypothetical protein